MKSADPLHAPYFHAELIARVEPFVAAAPLSLLDRSATQSCMALNAVSLTSLL
ncbi:MAG TPA: hypothetical protein VGK81_14580 [Anaerolineae bacterium]